MKITYVTASTELWGGIYVTFQHLELLAEAGHDAFLTTPAPEPDWHPLKVPIYQVKDLSAASMPRADIIVATSWTTIRPVVESGKGAPVHLCQGYEGDYKELYPHKAAIDEGYSHDIPRLTVSPHLARFLSERFGAETYYVGQMLDTEVFYPPRYGHLEDKGRPLTVLVVGPFEADFKNIATALMGVKLAKEELKVPLRLIRVSQFPLTGEEKEIIGPDVYHFHVPHKKMGDIYREADLLISMSKEEEGFGLPALEAMACGTPTILSSISSYTEFDEVKDYSLFVRPSDHESLALGIKEIFGNRSSRENLIRRGLSVAGKFTKDKMSHRLTNALESILRNVSLGKTRRFWDHYHVNRDPGLKVSWWDSPVILKECQSLITGDPDMDIYRFIKRYLSHYPVQKGLSICSGSGQFERDLIDNNICRAIDAYEIAEERVNEGIRVAQDKNYAIEFHMEDVNRAVFKQNHYDIFFSWSALHHIENLEGVCENARVSLKDKGLVVVQEYVGPNRFQWTDKQLRITNKILGLLPQGLRTSLKTGATKGRIERPAIDHMNANDPSEAIRSEEIIPVLQRFFEIKTVRYFGATICHLLFDEIIGNFDHDDEKDLALIRLIILFEQTLIEEKILTNDYALIIAEKG